MVLVLAWDNNDNFVCTMQFKSMYAFDEFNENISFDNPLSFEIIDLSSELDTLQ